jgi:hypothetical protein
MHSVAPQRWHALAAPLCIAFLKIVPMPFVLAHTLTCPRIMMLQETTSCVGILLNTLQASSMLPHLVYMSTWLLPTKTSVSKLLWIICWWTCLLSSSAAKLAHAFTTLTKVMGAGCTSWDSICQISPNAFCPCPHSHTPKSWHSKKPHCVWALNQTLSVHP